MFFWQSYPLPIYATTTLNRETVATHSLLFTVVVVVVVLYFLPGIIIPFPLEQLL
jgi:hypothetical protein